MGQSRPLNDMEIQQLAEQIIIGQKSRRDLDDLSADDRARVQRIVDRGAEALGELQRRTQLHQRHLRGKLNRSASGATLVAEINEETVPDMLRHCDYAAFDMEHILAQDSNVRRELVARLNRDLSEQELEAWLASLSPQEFEVFRNGLPERQYEAWEEARLHGQTASEDLQAIAAATSNWQAYCCLIESIQEPGPARSYVVEYGALLREVLRTHCREILERLGVPGRLGGLDERQERLLVGWTPREDLALMANVLESDEVVALARHLPGRARDEFKQQREQRRRMLERDLDQYRHIISGIKRWVPMIVRASES